MVSNGNHPLNHNQTHYDELTLKEYVLGQLLPGEEEQIRQHLMICPSCRALAADLQHLCQQVEFDLHKALDHAEPGPGLSFDRIASEWHKPPRRVTWAFRLQRLLPSASTAFLLILFVAAFLLLVPGSNATLRGLDLVEDYDGPPAMVAVTTQDGLVILRLSTDGVDVVSHLTRMASPRNMQFSSDGQWLALQHGHTLHIIEARESGTHIQIDLGDIADWAWSPDSQTLAYTDGTGQLALFDVVEQTNQLLVPAGEYAWGTPVWTDDGQQIAYAVAVPLPTSDNAPRRQGIWRVNPETGYRVELARNPDPAQTLLVPATWLNDNSALLAWDMNAAIAGFPPTLYRVDVTAHHVEQIEGTSLTQSNHLVWPVSSQDMTLAVQHNHLMAVALNDETSQLISDQIPWPHSIAWAPNGTWMAYVVSGAMDGSGLYLFTLQAGELRPIELPRGAFEKAVSWAGPEHLFVIRQPEDKNVAELWMVPLTSDQPSQRILTNARLPQNGPYAEWYWQDVLAMQVIMAED